jgi:hypothetical protein
VRKACQFRLIRKHTKSLSKFIQKDKPEDPDLKAEQRVVQKKTRQAHTTGKKRLRTHHTKNTYS